MRRKPKNPGWGWSGIPPKKEKGNGREEMDQGCDKTPREITQRSGCTRRQEDTSKETGKS